MIIQLVLLGQFISTTTIVAAYHERNVKNFEKTFPFLHSKTCKLCDEMCPLKQMDIRRAKNIVDEINLSEEYDDIRVDTGKVYSDNNKRKARHAVPKQCANDSVIVDYILGPKANYNNRNVPGGKVNNSVEVWVQEVTTIEDATSDFEVRNM
jgi:hypothetical protein